jgi:hypothetical protein
MNLLDLFTRVKPLPPGIYQKQSAPAAEPPSRIHLRLQPDGSGVLVINAATVLHLNPTAAEYAYHFVQDTPPEQAARQVASRYRINRARALEDFQSLAGRIQDLISTPDLDPVSYLDFDRVSPHSAPLTAPLRLDCALTYRLPRGAQADYAPVKRVDRELTTDQWCSILDKAWEAGIPHVTFTGGEATLREDLPALIARAEQNGQVCGLLTGGLKLAERKYLVGLLQTGLDHLLFILRPESELSWKALRAALRADIFVTVHLTLNARRIKKVNEVLGKLARLEVKSLSLSAADGSPRLRGALGRARDRAAELGLSLSFDLPVPYSAEHPVAHETAADEVPAGAGKAWLYVEPDGDVLPAQGMAGQILGNLLLDPWTRIYH